MPAGEAIVEVEVYGCVAGKPGSLLSRSEISRMGVLIWGHWWRVGGFLWGERGCESGEEEEEGEEVHWEAKRGVGDGGEFDC